MEFIEEISQLLYIDTQDQGTASFIREGGDIGLVILLVPKVLVEYIWLFVLYYNRKLLTSSGKLLN